MAGSLHLYISFEVEALKTQCLLWGLSSSEAAEKEYGEGNHIPLLLPIDFLCIIHIPLLLPIVCSLVPFCTRPVYFRVVLFLAPYFGLFIKFAFYRSKKNFFLIMLLKDA